MDERISRAWCGDVCQKMNKEERSLTKKISIKRTKKPLIEKRRRDRMNKCLDNIKLLILNAKQQAESGSRKMEKADVLEMTEKFLQTIIIQPGFKVFMEGISQIHQTPQIQHSPVTSTMPENNCSLFENSRPSYDASDVKNANKNNSSNVFKAYPSMNIPPSNLGSKTLNKIGLKHNETIKNSYNTSEIVSNSNLENSNAVSFDNKNLSRNNFPPSTFSTSSFLKDHIKESFDKLSVVNASKSDYVNSTNSNSMTSASLNVFIKNSISVSNSMPTPDYSATSSSPCNININKTYNKEPNQPLQGNLVDFDIKKEPSFPESVKHSRQYFIPASKTYFQPFQTPRIKNQSFNFSHQQPSYSNQIPSQQSTNIFFRPWDERVIL